MNSEYLFEKKGSDPDIERMEDLLSAYRIEPVAPALARTEHVEMPQRAHKRFRFVFAYAGAFAVFAVLITAAVLTVGKFRNQNVEVTAVSPAVVISDPRPSDVVTGTPPAVVSAQANPTDKREPIKPRTEKPITVRPFQYAKYVRPRSAAKPKLTPEEQYAYDQVRVALWLAGSKLKVVQDTINRKDESKIDSSTDKR